MKILYFAWLKEHTGQASEDMQLPDGVDTVGGLIPHITKQSAGHKTALKNLDAVRVAVNRVYGDLATPITNTDEVAFFPPVTGGSAEQAPRLPLPRLLLPHSFFLTIDKRATDVRWRELVITDTRYRRDFGRRAG